jgi:hypothetical protein
VLDERPAVAALASGKRRCLRVEYFVKWKGWPVEDATWEPASALKGCPDVLRAWRAAKQ